MRTIKVLDPRKLTKGQADEIISLWDKYSKSSWSSIIEQLKDPNARQTREQFDSTLLKILGETSLPRFGDLYDRLAQEIERIHAVMHRKDRS